MKALVDVDSAVDGLWKPASSMRGISPLASLTRMSHIRYAAVILPELNVTGMLYVLSSSCLQDK